MRGSSSRESLERHSLWVSRVVAWVAAVSVAGPFVYHVVRGSKAYLGLFEDDYFYYAIIADKLVTQGRLTYDGFTLTNGFHPLWLVVVAILRVLCGRFGTAFYMALALVFVASMVATFELSRLFARALGASAALAPPSAALFSLATDRLLASGMETALGVPLLFWLFVEVAREEPLTERRAAKLGVIASLAVLARLDIAIVVAILVVSWLVARQPPMLRARRALAAFCAGGGLVPAYFAANLCVFGKMLPVSALAKRLETSRGINLELVRFVATNTVYGPVVCVLLPLGVVGWIVTRRRSLGPGPAARLSSGAALLFPFAFYGVQATAGWVFFGWYAYPLAPAILAALVFVCAWAAPIASRLASPCISALAGALVLAGVSVRSMRYFVMHGPRWSIADNAIFAMGVDLAERMRDRRGVYGMGAMAGFASYVVDEPFVQLEGLVCDAAMLEHIRRRDALDGVLRSYHVDYLVVSIAKAPLPEHDGCFVITEPSSEWAGVRSSKMGGEICADPIARFTNARSADPWALPFSLETLVFDVRSASWRKMRDD